MKILKIALLLILISTISCQDSRYKLGLEAINKIENYRNNNHKLPMSLEELGINETESGPIYYQLKTDSTYII
jgi:hypothetical protein